MWDAMIGAWRGGGIKEEVYGLKSHLPHLITTERKEKKKIELAQLRQKFQIHDQYLFRKGSFLILN
jgi:hypothetical protein